MPLEHAEAGTLLPVAERRLAGRALRKQLPRAAHATWYPPANRRSPVDILIESGRDRIARLLPIRYDRMRQSAFAFLRGSAAVMAADLAITPSTGLRVQAGGDCHLANMGVYASPEGIPVFDLNDFDETLPAPFEWDLKRLAASFAVAGRSRNLTDKSCRALARSTCARYRTHMAELMRLAPLEIWRSRIDLAATQSRINETGVRAREKRRLETATDTERKGYSKLLERRANGWRIRPKPPVIFPLGGPGDDTHQFTARTAYESYKATLQEDRRVLLERYRLEDVAFKVVGVGSVGTFCALALLTTPDGDALLLQIKEAQQSVLAPFAGPSAYTNQGQRVVTGQRVMQAVSDVFLGWTQDPGDDLQCYVRQLKDSRLALLGTDMENAALAYYAGLCGRTLARAHARSGDPARIAGYMGRGETFDIAIAAFAMAYADQTEHDWRLFLDAIRTGRIEARTP